MLAVFAAYWLLPQMTVRRQNVLLLAASYIFYGWWDWRFLGLIALTSLTTYTTARLAASCMYTGNATGAADTAAADADSGLPVCAKVVTAANILLNAGILLLFKYFNFFAAGFTSMLDLFGLNTAPIVIDVLLPVGISFYTFQAISYSVDVCRRRITPCTDAVAFFTYIAYFPQLVAGPIERATHLLPQIVSPRRWSEAMAVSGMRMILFGVMKKVCVADMAAIYVDGAFAAGISSPQQMVTAALLFCIQIYCDFSAYSEIARGVSRLLGIELMANFRFPYFSRNILEFWQRWHISLMLWMRDYVYIPLGGNRRGRRRMYINTACVFLLSGLWHGAGWNYILWGASWALLYICGKAVLGLRRPEGPIKAADLPSMAATMCAVTLTFYIFRCHTMSDISAGLRYAWAPVVLFALLWAAASLLVRIGRKALICIASAIVISLIAIVCMCHDAAGWWLLLKGWWLIPAVAVLAAEWAGRNSDHPLEHMPASRALRRLIYAGCFTAILLSEPVDMSFIYFQF